MSLQLPAILSPPTPCIPSPALTVSPLARSPKWLRPPHANSPMHQAVSCSTLLYLWTGSSSPVASPPAFRRRSFLRLRTASVLSDGDFHPTVGAHSQAHVGLRSRATGVAGLDARGERGSHGGHRRRRIGVSAWGVSASNSPPQFFASLSVFRGSLS